MSCCVSCCASLTCGLCSSVASGISQKSARIGIDSSDAQTKEWYQIQAVLRVNGSLLPASVISLYCAYVCYTGLSSEPHDYECNGLNKSRAVSTGTLVLGMLTTVLSVLYSAVRAGSSTALLASPPSSPKSGGNKPLLEAELEEGKSKKGEEKESKPIL
ncbi:hypothetical protein Ahy_A04g021303 [Arachis hypogaea]|uniref:Uncharacterized protein n=1 Tax=Arachis hypogaea TaxID=3818 RepID=A0A445DJZ2_ARAHY|nr:hypothetical protein Ahy_A04g021303 [Arachis hypogaea]